MRRSIALVTVAAALLLIVGDQPRVYPAPCEMVWNRVETITWHRQSHDCPWPDFHYNGEVNTPYHRWNWRFDQTVTI